MTRKEAREITFAILFEKAITNEEFDIIIENAKESRDIVTDDFIMNHLNGIDENINNINNVIESNLKGWNLSRLSKVSVAVLRLAAWELMYDKAIPVSVTINEAVEITKTYGGKDDASYVNGVLSSIAKDTEVICPKEEKNS